MARKVIYYQRVITVLYLEKSGCFMLVLLHCFVRPSTKLQSFAFYALSDCASAYVVFVSRVTN